MRDNVVHRRHFLSYHNILFCQMYIFRSLLRTGYNRRAQCQRTDSSKIHGKNNDPFGRCIQDRGQSSGKTYALPEEQERTIDTIQQRIQELVPDCEERMTHSMEPNAGPCFEQTI